MKVSKRAGLGLRAIFLVLIFALTLNMKCNRGESQKDSELFSAATEPSRFDPEKYRLDLAGKDSPEVGALASALVVSDQIPSNILQVSPLWQTNPHLKIYQTINEAVTAAQGLFEDGQNIVTIAVHSGIYAEDVDISLNYGNTIAARILTVEFDKGAMLKGSGTENIPALKIDSHNDAVIINEIYGPTFTNPTKNVYMSLVSGMVVVVNSYIGISGWDTVETLVSVDGTGLYFFLNTQMDYYGDPDYGTGVWVKSGSGGMIGLHSCDIREANIPDPPDMGNALKVDGNSQVTIGNTSLKGKLIIGDSAGTIRIFSSPLDQSQISGKLSALKIYSPSEFNKTVPFPKLWFEADNQIPSGEWETKSLEEGGLNLPQNILNNATGLFLNVQYKDVDASSSSIIFRNPAEQGMEFPVYAQLNGQTVSDMVFLELSNKTIQFKVAGHTVNYRVDIAGFVFGDKRVLDNQ